MKKMLLTVPTFFGTESILTHEIRSLGYETSEVTDGKVTLEGDSEAIALLNINLRCGERVLIKMAEFKATTFEQLFEGVRAVEWEEFVEKNYAFPVKGSSLSSTLSSVPACQSIIKKAVVKRLEGKYGISHFEETGALVRIQFTIIRDNVTLYLDTTGEPLYKRGYRTQGVVAPMRETLAFSMIDITRWRGDRPFADIFCGSGTIPIEAALYAKNIAPGKNRKFVSETWSTVGREFYESAREEALENEKLDAPVRIYASDIDPQAVELAKENARRAGVLKYIDFKVCDMQDAPLFEDKGVLVSNPPYGERLLDKKQCNILYQKLGRKLSPYTNMGKYILTSHEEFEKFYGKTADKKRKLYNGMLKCYLYQYFK